MRVTVRVVPAPRELPPDGAPVTVEVRDVSMADAPSITVARGDGVVATTHDAVAVVDIEVDDELLATRRPLSVWARVGASGEPHVAGGDWITTQAYPLGAGDDAVQVEVRRI